MYRFLGKNPDLLVDGRWWDREDIVLGSLTDSYKGY
jgi:hypothetical protein